MTKEILIENLTKLINLKEKEKEIALSILLREISSKIDFNDALRINELGIFQLKKEPLPREERKSLVAVSTKERRTLIYSPLYETIPDEVDKLFQTFHLDELGISNEDDVEKALSLSFNKPLIPLAGLTEKSSVSRITKTGEENLHFEEKIQQLVASGIILKDFDIWEYYLNSEVKTVEASQDDIKDLAFDTKLSAEKEHAEINEEEPSKDETGEPIAEQSDEEITDDESLLNKWQELSFENTEDSDRKIPLEEETQESSETITPSKRNLFAELEAYLKEDEHDDINNIEKVFDEKEPEAVTSQEILQVAREEISAEKKKSFYQNKWFLSASGALVLFIIFILFFISGGDESLKTEKPPPLTKIEITEEDMPASEEPVAEIGLTGDELNKRNGNETKPELKTENATSFASGMYRKISTETQITNQVFFDGTSYTVQVSSWRNAQIAEREVNRLRAMGFDAFIYQVFLEAKASSWNRVRIGYFKTVEEAEDFLIKNKF